MKRKRSKRRLRNRIWFSTFGRSPTAPCHWCGVPMTFSEATLDHEPPLSRGGSWFRAVLACYGCNQKRGRENAAIRRE